jgi:transcriptional regulator with AAA-type ATPase domain
VRVLITGETGVGKDLLESFTVSVSCARRLWP